MYSANKIESFRMACRCRHGPSRICFIFCLLITSLFYLTSFANVATAATYYLDDANGNDDNDGLSVEEAWQTLSKCQSNVSSGDTIKIYSGNYGDFREATASRDDWIIYQAAIGESPQFESIYLGMAGGPYSMYLKFEGITIDAQSPDFAGKNDNAVYCQNVNYVYLKDCIIKGRYTVTDTADSFHGIFASSADNLSVENCTIYDSQMGVYTKYCNTLDVNGCEIYACRIGIQIHGDGFNVSNNHIYNVYSDGILANGKNGDIKYNHIHDLIRPEGKGYHLDGIQFYKMGGTDIVPSDVNVVGNRIYNVAIEGYQPGTYAQGLLVQEVGDNYMMRVNIRNNLIYNAGVTDCKVAGTNVPYFTNNTIDGLLDITSYADVNSFANNIVYQCNINTKNAPTAYVPGYHNYNIVWQFWIEYDPNFVFGDKDLSYEGNTSDFNALFVNRDGNDFRLANDSVAIGYANPAYAPEQDILGNPRDAQPDAGCYEYVSDPNNQAPVLDSIGDKSVDEGQELSLTISATDPNGDTITYTATGSAISAGADFNDQTLTFIWTPSHDQAGTYDSVRFIATDDQGAQDFEDITITVNNVNRPPVFWIIGDKSVDENKTLSFSVIATDPDGDTITYSLEPLPVGAVFGSQTFTWTPGYDQAGSYDVNFIAADIEDQDSETITITVINVNRAPVFSAIGNKSVYADDLLSFTVNATDPDGDTITYSASNLPSGADFDANTQTFSWTPGDSQAGIYDVKFIAADSEDQTVEPITITVSSDTSAPSVANSSPAVDSIQVPLNSLITLDVVDDGKGVDANSVTINVNDNIVYSGNTAKHNSTHGKCHRIGTKAHYAFIYQSNEMFDFDQSINVTAKATDLAGNVMNEYSYSFKTEMRSFGRNKRVDPRDVKKGRPVTVRDSNGNIWAAWHAGVADSRDIYIGKLEDGAVNFDSSVQLTSDAAECNPVTATGSDGKLYVAWQDNRRGNWDIYISTSNDWSAEIRVTDSNDNQINPAIVVDSSLPNNAYIVWEDDRNGNQDIYVAKSSDDFATKTVSPITSDTSDSNQVEPAIAVDSDNTVYVVWTDTRNKGKKDIYGAASNNGWTNVPVVTEEDGQSSPAIAAEADGSILHLVWVDDRIVDANDDIFYAKTDGGLPGSPLIGSSIIDDNTGADQISPVIITTGSTEGDDLRVFACWRDERNKDADLYAVEIGAGAGTNVFVGDDGTNSDQSEPAIGIDGDGQPYLVWTNERTDICYAGSTFIDPDALASENVSMSLGATVGTEPASISSIDDVSAELPQGAYLCDVKVTISRIRNPHKPPSNNRTFLYEFGPSGTTFSESEPVTITIPYNATTLVSSPSAYWYNPLTGLYSQEGITDVEVIQISSGLYALRFKTTHFSIFGGGGPFGGGGGGGGCSMSPNSQGSIVEFLLPYIGLTVVMTILKLRDRRKNKMHDIAKSEC